ncbi:hypothetical protein QTN47_07530 [Danxiaibacter flavus]|uniref:UbiA prenyltransferase family protein n=1 Tax=Danxiaibacter flavus TaxID=3049108 RepID=A0ABV3ZCW3_9BACT|nr:hypothetical protein QNM32_07530 [Chitinophagaceae bacterium DXS]
MFRKLTELIFFGNYFYASCAVALAIETNVQLGYTLNPFLFYVLLAAGTVYYYNTAYITESVVPTTNKRKAWYQNHAKQARLTQTILLWLVIAGSIYVALTYYKGLLSLSLSNWFILFCTPLIAILYYGLSWSDIFHLNLRENGFLKPFVIGAVWAGVVTIYPIMFKIIQTESTFQVSFFAVWLFIKNWMFITVLCIMFDIKDYATDHNMQLKTFVVRAGLRKTIFLIIIPLSLAGWLSFLVFAYFRNFTFQRILFNSIPFILLLIVAYSMHQRKSILYYLFIIDGLMLAKAVCGVLGVVFG